MSFDPNAHFDALPPSQPAPASQQSPAQSPQPVYYAPVYAQPQQVVVQQIVRGPSNGLATTSLVFGIIGIAVGFWAWIPLLGIASAAFGFPLALTAAITGHLGQKRADTLDGLGKNTALTGMILGYVTLGVIVLVTAFWIVMMVIGGIGNAAQNSAP